MDTDFFNIYFRVIYKNSSGLCVTTGGSTRASATCRPLLFRSVTVQRAERTTCGCMATNNRISRVNVTFLVWSTRI